MLSQLPGGRVAEMFSAKWVMFFAVFVNVLGTILTPPAAYLHYSALLVMRVLEGIGGVSNLRKYWRRGRRSDHVLLRGIAPLVTR